MHISAKTEYACIAMLELAANYGSGEPVRLRKIAETHGVPQRFLVQILLQLKAAGLVASTRGASGGYQLTKSPDSISLGMVMSVVEGPAALSSNATLETAASRELMRTWQELHDAEQHMLDSTTFADLVKRVRQHQPQDMYYI